MAVPRRAPGWLAHNTRLERQTEAHVIDGIRYFPRDCVSVFSQSEKSKCMPCERALSSICFYATRTAIRGPRRYFTSGVATSSLLSIPLSGEAAWSNLFCVRGPEHGQPEAYNASGCQRLPVAYSYANLVRRDGERGGSCTAIFYKSCLKRPEAIVSSR